MVTAKVADPSADLGQTSMTGSTIAILMNAYRRSRIQFCALFGQLNKCDEHTEFDLACNSSTQTTYVVSWVLDTGWQ